MANFRISCLYHCKSVITTMNYCYNQNNTASGCDASDRTFINKVVMVKIRRCLMSDTDNNKDGWNVIHFYLTFSLKWSIIIKVINRFCKSLAYSVIGCRNKPSMSYYDGLNNTVFVMNQLKTTWHLISYWQ